MAERSAADSKIKGLEEQMTLSEDNISKVIDLVKMLSPVGHVGREKDLTTIAVDVSLLKKINIIHQVVSYKIFSPSHVSDKVESLGFKYIRCDFNKLLATEFVKYLAVEYNLKDVGSFVTYNCHEMLCKKFFTKYYVADVLSEVASISQVVFDSKKLYKLRSQNLVGVAFDALESKIMTIKLVSAPTFNLNVNKMKFFNTPEN